MAASRRLFLKVLGSGTVASWSFGCGSTIGDPPFGGFDGVPPEQDAGLPGTGGSTGIGGSGSGAGGQSGAGGESTGNGGSSAGSGGQAEQDAGGRGGASADGGRAGGGGRGQSDAGRRTDAGSTPRDAGGTTLGPGDIVGGTIQNLAVGALNKISGQNVAIGRDSSGVYAMTMICTHQGCPINAPSGGTFSCPCHGSQFDRNGAVVRGPAGRPLDHFAVEIDGAGTIIVHTRTTVGANVRVAP